MPAFPRSPVALRTPRHWPLTPARLWLRPALLLTLASPLVLGQGVGLPLQVDAKVGQGQTFLTWQELPNSAISYRVYRSTQPLLSPAGLASAQFLGQVDSLTSTNLRLTELTGQELPFTITDGAAPLAPDQGLFVHTHSVAGSAYYAVTAVLSGVEDQVLIPGQNSTATPVSENPAPPRPILQQGANGINVYVHWTSNLDTPFAPAMSSQPSQPFNLQVLYNPLLGPEQRPLVLQLHERGGNFLAVPYPSEPLAISFSPDDWLRTNPVNSYWYGTNPAYPGLVGAGSPANVDYTVRRVMFELDWVQQSFPVDVTRVYTAGLSMGGSAAISLAYRYPQRFAAAAALVPKFDWGCQAQSCWSAPETGDLLWGSLSLDLACSEGVSTYDRLDSGFLLDRSLLDLTQADPLVARPPILALSGRQDTVVGWIEKPKFYQALQAARQPGICLWDNGTHLGSTASVLGPWKDAYALLESELWKYKRNQPQPVFTNFDLDGDPGNGDPLDGDLIGSLNAQISFDPDSVLETVGQHRLLVRLRSGSGLAAATVNEARADWTPRGLSKFKPTLPNPVRFENFALENNQLIQASLVYPDAKGLYTMPRARVSIPGNRWVLRNTTTAPYGLNLPSPNVLKLEVTGTFKLGAEATFVLSGLGANAGSATLALSLGQTFLPLFGGTLLVDPLTQFLSLSAPNNSGVAGFPLPIPQAQSLAGRLVYAQGFASSPLAPQGWWLSNGIEAWISP
jgi:Putative esterase